MSFKFCRSEVSSLKQNDLDSIMTDEHKAQEKIVETMLDMVKNIKQRSVAANHIIKQDILVRDSVCIRTTRR